MRKGSKSAVKSSLEKYFSMIIISSRHSDLRDEKNEKSENEFSSIDSLAGITNLFTELLFPFIALSLPSGKTYNQYHLEIII